MHNIKLIFFFLLLGAGNVIAQVNSVYSRFGIGNIEYSNSARFSGMGGLGTALDDKDFISTINPASWNNLSATRVEFGTGLNTSFVSDGKQNKYFSAIDFSGFSFAFPVSEKYGAGIALALLPYSKVNYSVASTSKDVDGTDINTTYTGEGGISKVFLGTSFRLPFDLAVGASVDYYFGNLVYKNNLNFVNSSNVNAVFEKSYKTNGIGGTFGLISPNFNDFLDIDGIKSIKVGVAYSAVSNLSTDSTFYTTTSFVRDTSARGVTNSELPARLSVGLAIKFNKYSLFYVDYLIQQWSKYRSGNNIGENLQDVSKISTGFEYRVNPDGITFEDLIIWRAGFSYEKTPFKLNGISINQLSLSAGVSLPVGRENTIDFGIRYALRGTNDSNLIKENIIGLDFALSFSELWFIRQDR